MIEKGLRDYLVTDTGLLAAVGYDVYPVESPENLSVPFLLYELSDAQEPRSLSGSILSRRYVYTIYACGFSFDSAKTLGDLVKAAFPTTVSTTLDSTSVMMFFTDDAEQHGQDTTSDGLTFHYVSRDLIILVK